MIAARLQNAGHAYFSAKRKERLLKFIYLLLFLTFGLWTIQALGIPIARMLDMFGRIGNMVANRLLPPDPVYATDTNVLLSVLETIEMSVLGAFAGTVISVAIAWLAAWNVTPNRWLLYPLARGVIVIARAVPELIFAMVLVTILGFGPMAGTIVLTISTIGFAGKLMAEQVEATDMGPVDAMRATGADSIKTFIYGVLPQVKPAWAGIAVYNWDTEFRSSTILGFVGAGGLGLYIRINIELLEYHKVMGVISLIVLLVIGAELLSHYVRTRFYR